MDRIRLLLLNDHVLFRDSLGRQLAAESDFEVMEAGEGLDAALETLTQRPVDVVLVDLNYGGPGGAFDLISAAGEAGYRGKILITASKAERKNVLKALQMGVSGIFLLQDSLDNLMKAVRLVVTGNAWLNSGTIQLVTEDSPSTPEPRTHPARLTAREEAVLAAILEGLGNKSIAQRMDISVGSVKSSVRQLFRKMGVKTRTQLVRVALGR
jgi:DNA-binding NarL/FixJ family response regulator